MVLTTIKYILVGLGVFLPGPVPDHPPGPAQQEGIEGTVYRRSGNHMPAPGRPAPSPLPVPATVYVFALTNESQVVHPAPGPASSYKEVLTPLIKKADTDDKGNFSITLPPGTYSVFTKKGDWFYATRRDEKNNIAPVKVLPGKMTRVECSVESDHPAVY